jgi:hypothetical protein
MQGDVQDERQGLTGTWLGRSEAVIYSPLGALGGKEEGTGGRFDARNRGFEMIDLGFISRNPAEGKDT